MCMFKHRKKNVPLNEDNEILEIRSDYDDDRHDDFDDAEENDEQNDISNQTFINPTQVENADCDQVIECEVCDFRARSRSDIIDHKTKSHNWCSICFSSFISQERLKKHLKSKHNKQGRTD